ncbi:ATP-binding protein [Paenibacillus harenae]|uniref:histidine kinase n=1 Tax=Paenibacillus harenae TaxID=306543 RepID=A0ABT9U5S6_PAEHA|nr:ATP-binding protein [Paenibacillus harenae]MDQ0063221.1 two-component system sensor histidine kinase YcbA [Paenibacillus harenae]MDQ0114991.1 two-component system sensor histidine kinase YcbA [Paenibacillus harenae]
MNNIIKNERLQMIAIALATAIGAQFKINPFSGDDFRIGLGVSIFLFFLLFMRHLSYLTIGILTGIFSMVFQAADWMIATGTFSIVESIQNNVAAGIYYVVFAFGMSRFQHRINDFHPLVLGAVISVIDFACNVTELFIRGMLLDTHVFYLGEWVQLMAVAVVRSYFVIGLYSSISISQMRFIHAEQQKRMEQMINIGAGLYGEVFYLKKSMETIESITVDSFNLARQLKEENLNGYSGQALGVAQQIHEVKKDSQRILAGLLKLYDTEIVVDLSLPEILDFVVKGNQKYSEMLDKKIVIVKEAESNFHTPHYIPLLTILNNLVSNAVEAIEKNGTITVQVVEKEKEIVFVVSDSGDGISEKDISIIFEPGFTTKFDVEGIAATGIGLSHVRDIVHSFGGVIEAESSGEAAGARFYVHIPITALQKGGGADVDIFRNRG